MSAKFYTRFVVEAGSREPSEYSGIVELRTQDPVPTDSRRIAVLLARDLELEEESIRVLQWSRLH